MDKAPSIIRVQDIHKITETCETCIEGVWYPARPIGYFSLLHRVKAAWLVFTGKADALLWPKQ